MACCGEGVQLLCARRGARVESGGLIDANNKEEQRQAAAGATARGSARAPTEPRAPTEISEGGRSLSRPAPLVVPPRTESGVKEVALIQPQPTATTQEVALIQPQPTATTQDPDSPVSPLVEITEEARQAASQPGRGLAERLKTDIANKTQRRSTIQLQDVRGFTGLLREGYLLDLSEPPSCCGMSQTQTQTFFAVKGPWMLKFAYNSPASKAIGVPIPLDGAMIFPVAEREFEICNVHVKADFYGKDALKELPGFQREVFEHSIFKHYAAESAQSRDQWVEILQAQVQKLQDRLARKIQKPSSEKCDRQWTAGSTGTVAQVNKMAVALFAQYEEDEEEKELQLHEAVYGMRVGKRGAVARSMIPEEE